MDAAIDGAMTSKEFLVMVNSSFRVCVEEVLYLVRDHSEKYQRLKRPKTVRERWSGWASLAGGLIFVCGEALRQLSSSKTLSLQIVSIALSILGLVIFIAAIVTSAIDEIRKSRRPFVEHMDTVVEALRRDYELIDSLERFEAEVLETAQKFLRLQSTKVASVVAMIGGGEGLRTSLVGIAMLRFRRGVVR